MNMPPSHYEKLVSWLGICEPQINFTLAKIYDENSPGCQTCAQRDKACKFFREHPGYDIT